MANCIQEGKKPVDKDWLTTVVGRGTISSQHPKKNEFFGIGKRTRFRRRLLHALQHSFLGDYLKSALGCTGEMTLTKTANG